MSDDGERKAILHTPRTQHLLEDFAQHFGNAQSVMLFSAPGRIELCGNHTDHQNGRVLAAAVDVDILAAVRRREDAVVRVYSQGFPPMELDLSGTLTPREEEAGTAMALLRGCAARFRELGGELTGFDACMHSTIPVGGGLSSSAAFEVLVAGVLNALAGASRFTALELARIGKYAENVFFGKPCGLMDQCACVLGGVVGIDFQEADAPKIQRMRYDFAKSGYAICIIDTGAAHWNLTREYAAIPEELARVSRYFGKETLGEVPQEAFYKNIRILRSAAGDRAILRAMHVYGENRRVEEAVQALEGDDFPRFLQCVRESGDSSIKLLQNITPSHAERRQELALTLALCAEFLGERGAYRVHGGGFAGTVLAMAPLDLLEEFTERIDGVLGEGSTRMLPLRSEGFCRLR